MNLFFATLVVLGCTLSASAISCIFPHKGDGGVLADDESYIPRSVLVFVDIANCAKQFADKEGDTILQNQWNSASFNFDRSMRKPDLEQAFVELRQAANSFGAVTPHITSNDELAAYFATVFEQFSDLLDKGDVPSINRYMIDAYPQFRKHLGFPL